MLGSAPSMPATTMMTRGEDRAAAVPPADDAVPPRRRRHKRAIVVAHQRRPCAPPLRRREGSDAPAATMRIEPACRASMSDWRSAITSASLVIRRRRGYDEAHGLRYAALPPRVSPVMSSRDRRFRRRSPRSEQASCLGRERLRGSPDGSPGGGRLCANPKILAWLARSASNTRGSASAASVAPRGHLIAGVADLGGDAFGEGLNALRLY